MIARPYSKSAIFFDCFVKPGMSKVKVVFQVAMKLVKLLGASVLFGYATAVVSTYLSNIADIYGIGVDMTWGAQVILMLSATLVFFIVLLVHWLRSRRQRPSKP